MMPATTGLSLGTAKMWRNFSQGYGSVSRLHVSTFTSNVSSSLKGGMIYFEGKCILRRQCLAVILKDDMNA